MPSPIGAEALIPNPRLAAFAPYIGVWTTLGRHPMVPGVTLHGRAAFEWHEGGAFVRMRTEIDEPKFPSGTAIFGSDDETGALVLVYFDERTVSRHYEAAIGDDGLRWWRTTPAFSQRWTLTISPDGDTLHGVGTMSRDGGPWEPDLELHYRRVK